MTMEDESSIPFFRPDIREPEVEEVQESLRSGWIGTGPKVERFEREFATYKQADHAAATNSCTAALYLSLETAGIGPGDEVVTTPMTFPATVNAILHTGARPVLADIHPRTYNIDPTEAAEAITDDTAALLPVHFAGRPCEMDALIDLVQDHELTVVEDCAHAIETTYDDRHVGTLGDFGCFSFYASKNITTAEGGMVLTPSGSHRDRIARQALHGVDKDAWDREGNEGYAHYEAAEPGWKLNMTDLQASLGLHQLDRVDENWERRQQIWERYQEAFSGLPVETPAPTPSHHKHAYHLYTVLVDEDEAGCTRDEVLVALEDQGIGTGVHYRSLPEHAYYRKHLGWSPEYQPHAHEVGRRTVSLPLYPNLEDREVETVIQAVEAALT